MIRELANNFFSKNNPCMNILSKAPTIHPIMSIPLPKPSKEILDNGLELYELRMGSQEILKLEWLFDAGRWYENKPLVARATAKLLKSGVPGMNADELADFFDFYGAKLKISDDFDNVSIRLYCLTKHLESLLPVMNQLFLAPTFDEQELQSFCTRNKQRLKSELQKNEVVAYRIFTETLFGNTHPYGYNSDLHHYDSLTTADLQEHHQRCYHSNACKLIVSGKTNDQSLAIIRSYAAALKPGIKATTLKVPPIPATIPNTLHLPPAKSSMQASIRIGSKLFDNKHPDYAAFYFVNTLLGGYFGARLMQNLREDKGYTYSVYSSMEMMEHGSYFYIYTDVNSDVKDAALQEIYNEIQRLQEEPVSDEELEMLRNYMLGMVLSLVDGVFSISAVIKELISEGLDIADFDRFERLVKVIREITPQQIQEIARKYFNREQLLEVVVG